MTGVEKIKEVRNLKFVKGLPIKEIVRRTRLSRNTVCKILRSQQTKFTYQRIQWPQPVTGEIRNKIEAWLKEDLSQKPKYRRTAWRMCEILKYEHGYKGSYESVAKYVKEIKPRIKPESREVYIPLSYSPGEAFQFDWGDVLAYIEDELVTLQLAVMTLCYSRRFYPRAYPCQKQELRRLCEFCAKNSCNHQRFHNLQRFFMFKGSFPVNTCLFDTVLDDSISLYLF